MNDLIPDAGFWDELGEQADAASSFGSSFGKCSIRPARYIHWQIDTENPSPDPKKPRRKPVEVDAATFGSLPAKEKSLDIEVEVDITEFRPDLEWKYARKVRPGDKDWRKTFVPSLQALLGQEAMSKGNFSATLQQLNGKYVEVEDVPQQGDPKYSTVRFVQIFESRDACFTAWYERFGGDSGQTDSPAPAVAPLEVPPNYDKATWDSMVSSIQDALNGGQTVPQVATDYAVEPKFIAQIKARMG